MPWDLYESTFRLKSPLHIGFHKISLISRTRPYVPGKLIWAALTARLTPMLGINNYQTVGQFLKQSIRYGYFYLFVDEKLYFPIYTEEGLKFGKLQQNEFEKKFISSMTSTAIQPQTLTAEEGMLHEIEFINPYTIDDGNKVYLKGLLWIKDIKGSEINISKEDGSVIFHREQKVVTLEKGFYLQIGGERRYGFGLIELAEIKKISGSDLSPFNLGKWQEQNGEVIISLDKGSPVLGHVKYSNNLNIKGDLELIVRRDWDNEKGAGKLLKAEGLFWMPGSILVEDKNFKVIDLGFWEAL